MKHQNAALIISLLWCLSITNAYYWDLLREPQPYSAYNGSALCAGVATQIQTGGNGTFVWFLQNGYYGNEFFSCYDIVGRNWIWHQFRPFGDTLGPGGAAAYGQALTLWPPNGWVFCL